MSFERELATERIMNQLRNQYIYQIKGTIQSQQPRKIPSNPQPFYQLNILCENNPAITKIFVFKNKVQDQVWQTIEQANCTGQRYLFFCQNYRGYYHVLEWERLSSNGSKTFKTCQYRAEGCQKLANYQHVLKLGSLAVEKQWVCSNCKQILENNQEHER